jgi:hypothetical protein
MKKPFIVCCTAFILIFCSASSVFAYSFSAMNGMTGAKTFVINPCFTDPITPSFQSSLDPVIGYGFSDIFDVYADPVGLILCPWSGYSASWIMPRMDLGGNNIVALQIGLQSEERAEGGRNNSFTLTPQYHFFRENDRTALEANLLLGIPWDTPEAMTISVIFAPVYKIIKDHMHVFLEVDPEYTLAGDEKGFEMSLQPGLWFGFPDGMHQFCISASISDFIHNTPGFGINLWYCFAFKTGQ